jgi:hypothetical protein
MRDDTDLFISKLIDESGEIEQVIGSQISAIGGPFAVSMTAQIRRDDMPLISQRARHPIPTSRVIAHAVHE